MLADCGGDYFQNLGNTIKRFFDETDDYLCNFRTNCDSSKYRRSIYETADISFSQKNTLFFTKSVENHIGVGILFIITTKPCLSLLRESSLLFTGPPKISRKFTHA